jgi:hypothetical protein
MLSDLHEAFAVLLVFVDCCRAIASASNGTGTVVGVAALLVPLGDEVAKGKTCKGQEKECWSHNEQLFEGKRFGVNCDIESLLMIK